MSIENLVYDPDYVVSPGEILEEILDARNIQKGDLAQRCGLTAKTVSLIINGKAPITPETAIQLERVLRISASIWNNLESKYRLYQAKKLDRRKLSRYERWLDKFPIGQLIQRDIIKGGDDTADIVAQLLDFFGVGNVKAWHDKYDNLKVYYHHSPSFTSTKESLALWLRLGEIQANSTECSPYNKIQFDEALNEIRSLSKEDPKIFEPRMKKLCAEAGVAVVFIAELQGTHLSGATRWIHHDKALIELSLRYKTDDHLWFTFYHEAGHILMHGKKNVYIDDVKITAYNAEEEQANRFAANRLIPKKAYAEFTEKNEYTNESILEFAKSQEIAPGIVVGRLQHDGIILWGSPFNHLKRRFVLVEKEGA
jgi:HTH-type transcriptional regulator/antitoxin HigA